MNHLGNAALSNPFNCHILTHPSAEPLAKKLWSGETASLLTAAVCSVSTHMRLRGGGGDPLSEGASDRKREGPCVAVLVEYESLSLTWSSVSKNELD